MMDAAVYRVIIHSLPKLLSSSSFRDVGPTGHVFFSPHAGVGKAVCSDLAYVQGNSSIPGGRNEKPVLALGASHIVQTSFSSKKDDYFSPSLFLLTISFWSSTWRRKGH